LLILVEQVALASRFRRATAEEASGS